MTETEREPRSRIPAKLAWWKLLILAAILGLYFAGILHYLGAV